MLHDVDTSAGLPDNGSVLVWNETRKKWVPSASKQRIHIIEEGVDTTPVGTVADDVTVSTQVPIAVDVSEAADVDPVTVVEALLVSLFNTIETGVDADDGWVSDAPSFTDAGATIQVGDSAGQTRQAFVRFVLPYDISGVTLTQAVLKFTPDANAATAVEVRVKADVSGTAAAPTSKADFDGRTLTTAFTDVSLTAVAGTPLADIDVTDVVQEVADAGTTTAVVFELLDNGSPTDAFLQLRSFAHSTGPFPTLVLSYS